MAFTRCTLILAIICFILIQELKISGGNQHIMVAADNIVDCPARCKDRCTNSPPPSCQDLCEYCCKVSNCIPAGIHGTNLNQCPHYAGLKNYFGKPFYP
ncbi:unnamed protein product [Lupinus luteus]|uniref:Uncharacterized protein n=1 Tax=Lupinus luteus TaxID=3873 RepID=A0AAV1VRR4_LUPLU